MTSLTLDRRAVLTGLGALAAMPGIAIARPKDYPNTQAFLDKYVDGKQLADCVVAIARGNRPAEFMSKGNLALDAKIPAGPASIFRIYSMSKPVTGATFMALVERGILRLDQPIADILPEFTNPKVMLNGNLETTRPASGPILMRHLVTHTSGLSYGIGQGPLAAAYNSYGLGAGGRSVAATKVRPTDVYPPARDLETFGRRLATLPLNADPGARFEYSVGLDLMGLIIQRASGMPFYDYMKQVILDPLGMVDTDFVVMGAKQARLTSVYAGRGGTLTVNDNRNSSPFSRDRDLPSGGGGLTSTAQDYVKFCQMLMNGGTLGRAKVLRPETVQAFRTNHMGAATSPASGASPGAGNGFGVAVQVLGAASPAGEGAGTYGWDGAAGTTMWVDPVHKVSVVGMVQIQGGTNIHRSLREAVYKDFQALGVTRA